MKELRLRRIHTANGAVIGVLTGLSKTLYTLEDQWRDNKPGESCIPTGSYSAVPHGWEAGSKVKFLNTWQLLKVPGRTAILMHAGNTHQNTEGCILVGMGMQITQTLSMISDSRLAVDFMRKEIGQSEFRLTIE